jgi:hypothetical protein
MKNTKPTVTSLVEAALREANDLVERDDLLTRVQKLAPGVTITKSHLHAALFHLRKHKCIDVVIDPDQRGWWCWIGDDDRYYKVEQIKDGVRRPGRRPRGHRKSLDTQ